MKYTRNGVAARAEQLGLQLSYYNPGDGGRYAIGLTGDYFVDDYFKGSLAECAAWLSGYAKAAYTK